MFTKSGSLLAASAALLFLGASTGASAGPAPGTEGHGLGSRFVEITGADDWQAAPPSGDIRCVRGDFDPLDLLQPCADADSGLKIRNASTVTFVSSADPRMSGEMAVSFSANYDASFSGPAWGTWVMDIISCEGAWEGTWTGKRSFVPGPNPLDAFLPPPGIGGIWVSQLEIVGHGSGCIDGLQSMGTETVTTLTPLPIAYEMIPGLCDLGCPPEGIVQGRILEPGRRADD